MKINPLNLLQSPSKPLKWSLLVLFTIGYSANLYAQDINNTEKVVRKVANQIIRKTSFRFKNTKTGKLYKSTRDVPETINLIAASKTNEWIYENGVLYLGMLQLGKVLKDDKYTNYSLHNFRFIFSNLDYFSITGIAM